MSNFAAATIPATFILAILIVATGCGGSVTNTSMVSTMEPRAETPGEIANNAVITSPRTNPVDSGPVMPNIDEFSAQTVTEIALAAYGRDWGDGSGVRAVWGPNITSGWALIGIENNSGNAGKDVLLQQENGTWVVRDVGHALSAKWQSQAPPDLWPST